MPVARSYDSHGGIVPGDRVVTIEGNPWFVVADVFVLEHKLSDSKEVLEDA